MAVVVRYRRLVVPSASATVLDAGRACGLRSYTVATTYERDFRLTAADGTEVRVGWTSRRDGADIGVDDQRLQYLVEAKVRRVRIAELHLLARDEHSISAADLRAPSPVALVRRYVPAIAELIGERPPDGQPIYYAVAEPDVVTGPLAELLRADALGLEARGRRRTRGAAREDLLRRVAREYRRAVANRLDPSPRHTVRGALQREGHYYSPAHVGRLIGDARRAGLLGPAKRGRAGEV